MLDRIKTRLVNRHQKKCQQILEGTNMILFPHEGAYYLAINHKKGWVIYIEMFNFFGEGSCPLCGTIALPDDKRGYA